MITHNIPIQVLRFFRNNEMQYQQYVENIMNFFHIDWILNNNEEASFH